jgi:dTDP-4-amino-4,6-dideoxygalactose transaminase
VEDAAHAFPARLGERGLGAIADLGCLSFHETKNLIAGEGGALLVQAPELVERAEIIWEKGTNRTAFFRGEIDKYTWVDIGSSFLPSELMAAFLWAQLENADRITERRKALCAAYRERLLPLERRGLLRLPAAGDGIGHVFYLLARNGAERQALLEHMKGHGVLAVSHYVPLHSSPMGRRVACSAGALPVTDRVAETLVRLPLYYEMQPAELERVCDTLQAFYRA